MKAANYEIWLNKTQQIWQIYPNLTDEVRMELKRNGWTFVLRKEEGEEPSSCLTGAKAAPVKRDRVYRDKMSG